MDALPHDFLVSGGFSGPKTYLSGYAHELAGRQELACEEWQSGLALVQERLKSEPKSRELKLWIARLHALLGESAESERALHIAQIAASHAPAQVTHDNVDVFVRLGHREEVLTWLTAYLHAPVTEWSLRHGDVRFSPVFDPLRGDARFEKLLGETLPEGAMPLDEITAT
jgi:hypothetical protein